MVRTGVSSSLPSEHQWMAVREQGSAVTPTEAAGGLKQQFKISSVHGALYLNHSHVFEQFQNQWERFEFISIMWDDYLFSHLEQNM